jgi:methyltransferase-like protein/2-polyprenyl-3-methyl-5-hydroxy-6-metoxy-1,4-benzoquinol methylase
VPNTPYDLVRYQSNPYPQTHPDHLGVMGMLFGMRPASADSCRVLELGCSSGGNLLPMATSRPGSTFVGVDLAESAIVEGRAVAGELGLTNVELRHGSVLDVDSSWGEFDYVICHGLYSWVPDEVRAGILRAIRQTLAPQGIAYVSYNALPGWALRGLVRDMVLFHVRGLEDPQEQVVQARALVDFLVKSTPEQSDYGHVLRSEQKKLAQLADWYVYHDNLAPEMRAFWFHEFSAHLDAAGLEYLGDAALSTMVLTNLDPTVVETLDKLGGDLYRMEQYMDFVRNRQFRQSLVVHAGIELERSLDWRSIQSFAFTSRVRPAAEIDVKSDAPGEFKTADGAELTTNVPLAKAMILELHERRPVPLAFDDVVAAARRRVYGTPSDDPEEIEADRRSVGQNLFSLFASDVAQPRRTWPAFASTLSERPEVWPYARWQAANRAPFLTNLRHEGVEVDELDRHVAVLLDGTRTIGELVDALIEEVHAGELIVRKQEGDFESEAELREAMAKAVGASLTILLRSAVISS